jgi:hypothetical protein
MGGCDREKVLTSWPRSKREEKEEEVPFKDIPPIT